MEKNLKMEKVFFQANQKLLSELVGRPFRIAMKHPKWNDLYRLGFGDLSINEYEGKKIVLCEYNLHVLCPFRIGRRKNKKEDIRVVDVYDCETSREHFQEEISRWYGLKVKEVILTKENDLLLNLGECGILFITYLDGRESWRIFRDDDQKHLVATNEALSFE